ncbi:MAG: glycosyltransferase [Dongiaceae bacterium]
MSLPKISVVIPSLNQGRFLSQALESIIGQAYPSVELIVMDGGSADESLAVIRHHAQHIRHWQSGPDGGQAAAINAGMRIASGEIVCWLNADDLFCDGALRTIAKAAIEHPGAGIYIGNGFRLDERTGALTPFCRRSLGFDRQALRLGLDYVLQPATFFRRSAWNDVGGVDPMLHFVLDWDVIVRISDRYPVALVNEFIAISREHAGTKTANGGFRRILEITETTARWGAAGLTPGAVLYLLETMRSSLAARLGEAVRERLDQAAREARQMLGRLAGNEDGFPHRIDDDDDVYVPLPRLEPRLPTPSGEEVPRISIVTPSFNQASFLERALRSVVDQGYPKAEIIVMDGASTDRSVEILRSLETQITRWESAKDRGPAHAINKGFAAATGDILGWLNSDDMLADEALWTVAKAFAEDPELEMVFANAMYVDSDDRPILVDHGLYRTSLYYGVIQDHARVPAYWSYDHGIPQPTVFFRRRLLERCGPLDERYKYIFDFELFFRFSASAKVRKIERTIAFYRIHGAAKTADWGNFLVELYRFSRPKWPRPFDPDFGRTLRDFTGGFMRRVWRNRRRGAGFKAAALLVAFMAATRIANPEAVAKFIRGRLARRRRQEAHVPAAIGGNPERNAHPAPLQRAGLRYKALFAAFFLPRYPGTSGGEIRDYHLLRELLHFCEVSLLSLYPSGPDARLDPLSANLAEFHDPETLARKFPELTQPLQLQSLRTFRSRLLNRLRRADLPVWGPKLNRDPSLHLAQTRAYMLGYLGKKLAEGAADFVFVSPQINPVGLVLDTTPSRARFILATYDVEAVRALRLRDGVRGIKRLAAHLESRRAEYFERNNLRAFDGVIAVSELDRGIFIERYGFAPERVLALENGVDTEYFAFETRRRGAPPSILFTGNFGYRPNHDAAMRLVRRIMPRVWEEMPDAQLWIVGARPGPELAARSDGRRVFVTGQVESVRGYFRAASLFCAPLESGSGTKYKILEALASGVPIVCTELAREGFEMAGGEHLIAVDDDRSIAAKIVWLTRNPDAAERMAAKGRAFVEATHDWRIILPKLAPWLDGIARLPKISPH